MGIIGIGVCEFVCVFLSVKTFAFPNGYGKFGCRYDCPGDRLAGLCGNDYGRTDWDNIRSRRSMNPDI